MNTTAKTPDLWSEQGVFARHFPGYEPRNPQQTMYQAVRDAIENHRHLAVEAGTGTGKGLAYLAPIILHSQRHPDARYVISTATIGLQEQLAHQDVPAAVAALSAAGLIPSGGFSWTVLKGRNNYLCRERCEDFIQHESGTGNEGADRLIKKLRSWTTETGDVSELTFRENEKDLWHRVSAQFNTNCPYFQNGDPHQPACYLKAARLKARDAHLTIVNHALLFADLANNENQLGHASYVILDEAQRIEDIASDQFGWELLQSQYRQELDPQVSHPVLGDLVQHVIDAGQSYWRALARCIEEPQFRGDTNQLLITPACRDSDEWKQAIPAAESLEQQAAALLASTTVESHRLNRTGDPVGETALGNLRNSLEEQLTRISTLMAGHNPDLVHWLQRSQERGLVIRCIPLKVGPILRERLFSHKQAVVLTSATLTTDTGDFQLIRQQTGFPPSGRELTVGSPFDYPRQARFMSPSDLPSPRNFRDFSAATAQCLTDVAQRLRGHTLALFTSYAALNDCAKRLRESLSASRIEVLAQGRDGSPETIIQRFRNNQQAIILGAATFWEGVDFGDLLHAVAICRLPFPVPTDPVVQARSELYQDPFSDYHVPTALLRFRQGCGRLIRNQHGVGSIIVLDPRIRHPRYGSRFYQSLPPCTPVRSRCDNVGDLAAQWVASRNGNAGQSDMSDHLPSRPRRSKTGAKQNRPRVGGAGTIGMS